MTLIEYFGAALVINLPERVDRRKSAEKEFRKARWKNVHFFPALKFDDPAGFKFSSWRGCFHSHLACLRFAHESRLDNILVLEDDIALSPAIPKLTPAIIETIRKLNWDFLYFGHEETGDISRANSHTERIIFERCNVEFLTAHFYAVNKRIIPRLIAHFERLANGVPGDHEFGPM